MNKSLYWIGVVLCFLSTIFFLIGLPILLTFFSYSVPVDLSIVLFLILAFIIGLIYLFLGGIYLSFGLGKKAINKIGNISLNLFFVGVLFSFLEIQILSSVCFLVAVVLAFKAYFESKD